MQLERICEFLSSRNDMIAFIGLKICLLCHVKVFQNAGFIMMKIMHYLQHGIGNVSLISGIIFSAIKAIMPFLEDKESHHFIRLKLPLTRGRRIQECKAVIARFNLARKTILC